MRDRNDAGDAPAAGRSGFPAPARLTEFVLNALNERISGGQYPRRTRLPSERDLAIEFEVSRPVVRAALARLREAGLVESIKGSGSIVLREPASPLRMTNTGTRIRDLQRCFEFRLLVEGEAAYLAARRATPSLLDEIRQDLDSMAEALERGEAKRGDSFDFHRGIARASDNAYYLSALDLFSKEPAFQIYLHRSVGLPSAAAHVAKAADEHRQIFELVARGEAEEARIAMCGHIERARDNFMECLPLG